MTTCTQQKLFALIRSGCSAIVLPAMSALQVGMPQKRSATASGSDSERVVKRGNCQSGDSHPAQLLQSDVLDWMMEHLTAIAIAAHKPIDGPRPTQDKNWKTRMRGQGFGSTVNTLQRAYSKMLHETFDNECPSDVAANVRNLADAVSWKLRANCLHEKTEEGTRLLELMLSHLQIEFKWEKIAGILEAAAEVARRKKEESDRNIKTCQDELHEIHMATRDRDGRRMNKRKMPLPTRYSQQQ